MSGFIATRESGAEAERRYPFKFVDGQLVLSYWQLETLAQKTGIPGTSVAETVAALQEGYLQSGLRYLSRDIVKNERLSLQPCAWNMLMRRRYIRCSLTIVLLFGSLSSEWTCGAGKVVSGVVRVEGVVTVTFREIARWPPVDCRLFRMMPLYDHTQPLVHLTNPWRCVGLFLFPLHGSRVATGEQCSRHIRVRFARLFLSHR